MGNIGRELAVYNRNTDRLKYFNLFGNGSLGRVEVSWDSVWVEDPNHESSGYLRYSRNDYRYYYIKDHLGSIRITIDETGNVVNAQDYYSFGGILRSYNNAGGLSGERYKFTGKERDTETGYDYFGARYYDSDLGRWLTPDPLTDLNPGISTYCYAVNNPLRIIDPDGRDTLYFDNQGKYLPDQPQSAKGGHAGYYYDKDRNLVRFNFNDQSDAESNLYSVSTEPKANIDGMFLTGISIGDNPIGEGLVAANLILGANSPLYPLSESQKFGKMDYVYQMSQIDLSLKHNVTVIDGVGYNNFDLGNYYWGKTMGKMGYAPSMAKFAAQVYERVFNQRADDPTDQRAIGNGAEKK